MSHRQPPRHISTYIYWLFAVGIGLGGLVMWPFDHQAAVVMFCVAGIFAVSQVVHLFKRRR